MPTSEFPLLDHIRQLIAVPSVSSVSPLLDQSNRPVIDLLAGWLEQKTGAPMWITQGEYTGALCFAEETGMAKPMPREPPVRE